MTVATLDRWTWTGPAIIATVTEKYAVGEITEPAGFNGAQGQYLRPVPFYILAPATREEYIAQAIEMGSTRAMIERQIETFGYAFFWKVSMD